MQKNQTGEKNEDIYDNPKFTANFVQQMLAYLSCQAIIVVRRLLFTKTGTVYTTVPYFFAVCPGGEGAVLKTVGPKGLAGSNPVYGALGI